MSVKYCRLILRVPPEMPERLTRIQEHLLDETRLEYPFSAILRGLIELGLNQIEGAPYLAVLFAGCRVKRGRKPGSRLPTVVVPLDLTKGEMDLEFEDEYHEDRLPKPKNEVVARERTRRRRRPLRDAGLLEPKASPDDGSELEDEDTLDERQDDDP